MKDINGLRRKKRIERKSRRINIGGKVRGERNAMEISREDFVGRSGGGNKSGRCGIKIANENAGIGIEPIIGEFNHSENHIIFIGEPAQERDRVKFFNDFRRRVEVNRIEIESASGGVENEVEVVIGSGGINGFLAQQISNRALSKGKVVAFTNLNAAGETFIFGAKTHANESRKDLLVSQEYFKRVGAGEDIRLPKAQRIIALVRQDFEPIQLDKVMKPSAGVEFEVFVIKKIYRQELDFGIGSGVKLDINNVKIVQSRENNLRSIAVHKKKLVEIAAFSEGVNLNRAAENSSNLVVWKRQAFAGEQLNHLHSPFLQSIFYMAPHVRLNLYAYRVPRFCPFPGR